MRAARRRRVPHRRRAERALDRRRVRARLHSARRRRARCRQGRAGARARARRRDRGPRARRRRSSGRRRERARADRGSNAAEISAQVDRTAAPVLGAHAAPAVGPRTAFADPQFLPRGELGVMLGPIPPIPPPGAQVAARRRGRSRRPRPGSPASRRRSQSIRRAPRSGSRGPMAAIAFAASRGKLTVLAVAGGYAEARSSRSTLDAARSSAASTSC